MLQPNEQEPPASITAYMIQHTRIIVMASFLIIACIYIIFVGTYFGKVRTEKMSKKRRPHPQKSFIESIVKVIANPTLD
ncbi:MAG: hypothetical protein EZS28_030403 [Streblomastix strix]|uniref:Uncharacterized protein n=1 Tax=Streblomastix strix TaxID=222440 RepID=A0A5J4UW36_9EUKA|nr:MAG: hypothetical protein EZS28_030403 [Streblomastix strix]